MSDITDIDKCARSIEKRIIEDECYRAFVNELLCGGLAAAVLSIEYFDRDVSVLFDVCSDAALLCGLLEDAHSNNMPHDISIGSTTYTCNDYVTMICNRLFGGMTLEALCKYGLCPSNEEINIITDFYEYEDIDLNEIGPLGILILIFTEEITIDALNITSRAHSIWTFTSNKNPCVCVFGDNKLTLKDMAIRYDLLKLRDACDNCVIDCDSIK